MVGYQVSVSGDNARITLSHESETVGFTVPCNATSGRVRTLGVGSINSSGLSNRIKAAMLRFVLTNASAIRTRIQEISGQSRTSRARPESATSESEGERESEPEYRRRRPARPAPAPQPQAPAPPTRSRRATGERRRYDHSWVRSHLTAAGEGDSGAIQEIHDNLEPVLGNRNQRLLILASILDHIYDATGGDGGRFYFHSITNEHAPQEILSILRMIEDGANNQRVARSIRDSGDETISLISSYLRSEAQRTGSGGSAGVAQEFSIEVGGYDQIPEELNRQFIEAVALYVRRLNCPDAERFQLSGEVSSESAQPDESAQEEAESSPAPPEEHTSQAASESPDSNLEELISREEGLHSRGRIYQRTDQDQRTDQEPEEEQEHRTDRSRAERVERSTPPAQQESGVEGQRRLLFVGDSLTEALRRFSDSQIQDIFNQVHSDADIQISRDNIYGYSSASAYDITRYFFQGRNLGSLQDPRRSRARRMLDDRVRLTSEVARMRRRGERFTDIYIEMGGNDLGGRGLRDPEGAALRVIQNLQTAYQQAERFASNVIGVTLPPAMGYGGWNDTNERARNLVNRWIRGEIALITGDGGRISEIIELDDYGQRVEQGSIDPEADNVIAPPNISAVINLDQRFMANSAEDGYGRRARAARAEYSGDGIHFNRQGYELMLSEYAEGIHIHAQEMTPVPEEPVERTRPTREEILQDTVPPDISLKSGKIAKMTR